MTDEEIFSKVSKIDLSKLTCREKDHFIEIIDVLSELMILRNFFSVLVIALLVFLIASTLATVIFRSQQFSIAIAASLIICFVITACMTLMLYLYSDLINAALAEYDLLLKRTAGRKEEE